MLDARGEMERSLAFPGPSAQIPLAMHRKDLAGGCACMHGWVGGWVAVGGGRVGGGWVAEWAGY